MIPRPTAPPPSGPRAAAEKCAALLVVIKGANDKVCGIPSTVEEFVEFTAALAKITDEQVR